MQVVAPDRVGCAKREKYFFRTGGGIFRIGDLREQDNEFIAALATDRVGIPHTSEQSFRHALKERIAGGMPQRIVDIFEMIHIQKDHRTGSLLAASQGNRLSDPVV